MLMSLMLLSIKREINFEAKFYNPYDKCDWLQGNDQTIELIALLSKLVPYKAFC